ncbi:MAG TPA: trifunctional transcriptional regulator/proline dehydrogenase/L-glutamate gamma-semialdehyde dehydrogenase, partial [Burkholderiales bacterium]|nr:trifunctional transcriptional regulator/proline dehydrogenase/L-glutamate gamma-semialdehyde dehydrogenase [Burkholderiales bacterium]
MDERIRRDHRIPEAEAIARLRSLQPDRASSARIGAAAMRLAQQVRASRPAALSAESFLRHYNLSTQEGVALMCVAEALLRIPDPDTADALLREKLSAGKWGQGGEDSWAASAADWALMLTGTLARWREAEEEPVAQLKRLAARLGEPVVRT